MTEPREPFDSTGSTDPAPAGAPSPGRERQDPPGIREQLGNTVAAGKRLIGAHIDLAKAEASEIAGEVGRAAALGGMAFGCLLLVAFLLPVGTLLFLGDWLFGSIGWGVLLGGLLLIDVAVVAVVVALGFPGARIGRAFGAAAILGIVAGVVLALNLTNRGWTLASDQILPTFDAGSRPLILAVAALAIVGAVIGQIMGFRSGGAKSALGGLLGGAIAGALLGVLTAIALGPQVGAAFGVLTWLIAWPALTGLDVSRTGIDTDALKARFYPEQTIETTKETIEWVRERTPLVPKS